jgi:hypothetical protein
MSIAKKVVANALVATVAIISAGCSGLSVVSDFDPAANFSAFQTFEWLPDTETEGSGVAQDPLIDRRIRMAINDDLVAKGFRLVEDGGDFAVGSQLSTREDVSYSTMHSGWGGYGYGYGYWGGGMSMGTSTTTRNTSTVGQLLIGVFDEGTMEMVWRGTGEKTISNRQQSPEDSQNTINDIVSRIMETFPPGN